MSSSLFEYKLKVRDYECDAQGIVNNANYQHYYEVVRHEFLEQNGLNFYELHEDGIDAVVVSVYIRYKHSLRGSNDFICTATAVRDGVRYYFHQEITRISDNTLCAKAVIEVVCLINGKVTAPDMFDKAFADYLEWKK